MEAAGPIIIGFDQVHMDKYGSLLLLTLMLNGIYVACAAYPTWSFYYFRQVFVHSNTQIIVHFLPMLLNLLLDTIQFAYFT